MVLDIVQHDEKLICTYVPVSAVLEIRFVYRLYRRGFNDKKKEESHPKYRTYTNLVQLDPFFCNAAARVDPPRIQQTLLSTFCATGRVSCFADFCFHLKEESCIPTPYVGNSFRGNSIHFSPFFFARKMCSTM